MERLIRDNSFTYMKIRSNDPEASAKFYGDVFGWNIRDASAGRASFDDASGYLSGSWEHDLDPSPDGILPFIYTNDVEAAIDRVRQSGGEVVQEPYDEGGLRVATFRDPSGNVVGLWNVGRQ